MKKLSILLLLLSVSAVFHSCLKDVKLQRYTYYTPVFALKTDVRKSIQSDAPQPLTAPGRIYVQGNYIYVNEIGKGIHIIDFSNPSSPQNVAFIPIPGNMNMAIEGNYLYADESSDLLTIDISDPLHAKLVGTTPNAFTEYYNYGGSGEDIIVSWQRTDTMIKSDDPIITQYPVFYPWATTGVYEDVVTSSNNTKSYSGGGSSGGSMAQFTVVDDRLYTVSAHYLNVFSLDTASQPSFVNSISVIGSSFQTIYPFENNLFLGSDNAMYIYDATDKNNPVEVGNFGHVHVCDPVIAEPGLAYVTLRSGSNCGGTANELDVLNTSTLTNPVLVSSYTLTNPRGLAKEGNNLFVCDGQDGLKIFDATDVNHITQINAISDFEANDVILRNGTAIVTAADGLYLVDYRNTSSASVMSKIDIHQ